MTDKEKSDLDKILKVLTNKINLLHKVLDYIDKDKEEIVTKLLADDAMETLLIQLDCKYTINK